jgi:hypothetical protein
MKKQEVAQLLLIIKTAYPNFEVNERVTEYWCKKMEDMPFKKAMRALDHHTDTSSYPPTAADIKTAVSVNPEVDMFNFQIEHQRWVNAGGDPEAFVYKPYDDEDEEDDEDTPLLQTGKKKLQ